MLYEEVLSRCALRAATATGRGKRGGGPFEARNTGSSAADGAEAVASVASETDMTGELSPVARAVKGEPG